jgi:hypothetical protein
VPPARLLALGVRDDRIPGLALVLVVLLGVELLLLGRGLGLLLFDQEADEGGERVLLLGDDLLDDAGGNVGEDFLQTLRDR